MLRGKFLTAGGLHSLKGSSEALGFSPDSGAASPAAGGPPARGVPSAEGAGFSFSAFSFGFINKTGHASAFCGQGQCFGVVGVRAP